MEVINVWNHAIGSLINYDNKLVKAHRYDKGEKKVMLKKY